MNKQIILNALRKELERQEQNLMIDKIEAAYYWDCSDKSKPELTAENYNRYKFWKNQVRSDQKKLRNLRTTIRQVKGL
jgi:hypothetical protein